MSLKSTRREFLGSALIGGFSIWIADPARAQGGKSPNERVQFACIGVGGKGDSDTADAARLGDVVAICDVDENTLNRAAQKYPMAKKYNDYRKMLEEMGSSIDAVTVSTPDHSHAPAALMAMEMGKHCFCQKPLAHSIYEIHRMMEVARRKKLATQMGNQGTAGDNLRRFAAMVRAGAIGDVTEVHVWTNRPIWPQGISRPPQAPVPAYLHWNLWIGPAPFRPYAPGYHPFSWRGWWDFGTGALGDMACHTMNLPFMALDLRDPIAVEAETSGTNHDSYPSWSIIHYYFGPAEQVGPPSSAWPADMVKPFKRSSVVMHWYDGGKLPPDDVLTDVPRDPKTGKISSSGSLMIGTKGKVYSSDDYGSNNILIGGVDVGEVPFPQSPGHFEEFVRAIKEGIPAMSNFPDYAGPLASMAIMGNLAVWSAGKKIEWDARRMVATNAPEVMHIVHPTYRHGYHM